MGFRNISAWSIRNPIPPLVLFMALTIAGLVSFMRMDVNQDPDIEFPVAIIVISQPGAAPTELETQVTQRVEAAVRSIQGIDEINSTVSEGNSTTVVQLDIGTPIDRAVTDVREAVNQIRSELPEGLSSVVRWLPSAALGDAVRAALVDGAANPAAWAVLLAWAALATALAGRMFRWSD